MGHEVWRSVTSNPGLRVFCIFDELRCTLRNERRISAVLHNTGPLFLVFAGFNGYANGNVGCFDAGGLHCKTSSHDAFHSCMEQAVGSEGFSGALITE